MTIAGDTYVWYVAYGSNIDGARFARYLSASPEDHRVAGDSVRWTEIHHDLYFAGTSKTWGGPVAFLAVPRNPSAWTRGLARLLLVEDVEQVARKENGAPRGTAILPTSLPEVDAWVALDVPQDETKGKYNALLRLPDIDGRPAITLTTLRTLPLGAPTVEYRALIEHASQRRISIPFSNVGEPNSRHLPPAINMDLSLRSAPSTGLRLMTLSTSRRPDEEPLLLGRASSASSSQEAWIRFDGSVLDDQAGAHQSLIGALMLHVGDSVRVDFDRPLHFKRLPGRSGDIPESDVIYLSASDASRYDGWALLITDRATGPVRVRARAHVPDGAVRVAYALRAIVSMSKDADGRLPDYVALQPLLGGKVRIGSRISRAFMSTAEFLVGAPPLALRSTEALVGDDGRDIVRVDPTVLDFLGCSSGDSVIVSWARRSCRARVLLHTDVTRERMREQLAESTGMQSRESTGNIDARLATPVHMQAWVSSTVRHKLNIPEDSVVRLRRSITRTVAKHSALLLLPSLGLLLAALAIPDLRAIALAVPLAIVLALLPIRMPHRYDKEM